MTLPLLSGRAIGVVRRAQVRLFATGLALADPPRMLVLERYNTGTTAWEELPEIEVLMRFATDPGGSASPGAELVTPLETSPTAASGTFTATEPFDVKTADRFTIGSMAGHVVRVYPARNGKRRAQFILDTDVRGDA